MKDLNQALIDMVANNLAAAGASCCHLAGLDLPQAREFATRISVGKFPKTGNAAEWRRFARAALLEMLALLQNGEQS